MQFQAAIFALLLATASGHAMRGTEKMQPELVAHTLLRVEDEWRSQAASFADCNATATDASTECAAASKAFGTSCATVVNAVVQASSGDRSNVREYMSDICGESELKGWRQERCSSLAMTINKAMTDNNADNREGLDASNVCTSFWSTFTAEEQVRVAKERAEREAEEKLQAEEKAAAEKKAAEEAAAEEKRRLAEEADNKAKEAKAKADEAAERLVAKQAEAAQMAEEAQKKAEEAKTVAAEVKQHQADANKTASAAQQVHQAINGSVATNATKPEPAAKAENVTVAAPAPKANATENVTTAPAAPKAENKTVAPKAENKTVALVQAASCASRNLGVFALLSEKVASMGPDCEAMCDRLGARPNCQCPGFAGQPASADDSRACIVKYCQDPTNKCPNDAFDTCVAENTKVSALQWDAVMSRVSHGFESLAAAVRMSKK